MKFTYAIENNERIDKYGKKYTNRNLYFMWFNTAGQYPHDCIFAYAPPHIDKKRPNDCWINNFYTNMPKEFIREQKLNQLGIK